MSVSYPPLSPCTNLNGKLHRFICHIFVVSHIVLKISSPKWIRGAVVSGYQWAITIGLLLASVINNATQSRNTHASYRIPISVQFIWAFILAVGMLFLPESPRWLIKRGKDADAAAAISRLTGAPVDSEEIEIELSDIRANLKEEEELGESSYIDMFRPGQQNQILFRVCTGIALQAWQQLTGINFIFYYGTAFFQNSGIANAFIISVATNIVNVFMTLPGMWGVERYGRRRLLLVGAVGMCICEFLIAIIGVTISVDNKAGQKCLVAFVCIYIVRIFFSSRLNFNADSLFYNSIHRLSSHLPGDLSLGLLLEKYSH